MKDHPVWFWIGVLTLVTSVWWYLEDERKRNVRWFAQDVAADGQMLGRLERIEAAQVRVQHQIELLTVEVGDVEARLHGVEDQALKQAIQSGEHLGDHKYMERLIRGERPSRPTKPAPWPGAHKGAGLQDAPGR